jgi:hypothetical protein
MSERYIVEYCSPTLAGLKTGNLFSVKVKKEENIYRELRKWNHIFLKRGLRVIPVKFTESYILLYLYRPAFLARDLKSPKALEILKKKGYRCGSSQMCLMQLIDRLKQDESFPHEIGLFLGYPPSDVEAFMKDSGKGVKSVGCWKAYDNEKEAEKIFSSFQSCTEIYKRRIRRGSAIEQLIVEKQA